MSIRSQKRRTLARREARARTTLAAMIPDRADRDAACISRWLPLLQASGVPVPDTVIVETDLPLIRLLDGEALDDDAFVGQLRAAAIQVGGYPVFLRTGHGSGKHEWKSTCFVERPEDMGQHMFNLVEWSACVDLVGLPTRVWAVRKFLHLDSDFIAFDGFPVNRERRYFIADGRVRCSHPYWPEGAVAQSYGIDVEVPDWREKLAALNEETPDEIAHLTRLSEQVAAHFDGAWSLDWAMDVEGKWWAIDMAPAGMSFHWPACPEAR